MTALDARRTGDAPLLRRAPKLGRTLGPGLITGASDDDPSGIGTYSQAGAQFGFGIGWTMVLTFPLMVAIQEICARIGRTTGHGIAGNLCRHYPAWLLYGVVSLLFLANAINIGADLSAMAAALELLIGGSRRLYVIAFGSICIVAIIYMNYARYVTVLKWLTLSLFAYVATLFAMRLPWGQVLVGLVVPHITWNVAFFTTLLAIFGTTISPYLFFWQARRRQRISALPAAKSRSSRRLGRRRRRSPIYAPTRSSRDGVLEPHRARDHFHDGDHAA
jgi:NRAMP (natural resistance-associated macrophage protein)-like metal ion transporter